MQAFRHGRSTVIFVGTKSRLGQVRQTLLDTGYAQYAGAGTRSEGLQECFAIYARDGIAWGVEPVAVRAAAAEQAGWVPIGVVLSSPSQNRCMQVWGDPILRAQVRGPAMADTSWALALV